jgi:membrane-associated phospholipid phosphatase
MGMLEKILGLDRKFFFFINQGLRNPVFDFLLPYMRNSITWIPLYLALLYFIPLKFKMKGWYWIALAGLQVALTDLVNSRIIKHIIMRPRPCNDVALKDQVHLLLKSCPISSGFPSSHAVNHVAFAAFFFFTLRKPLGNKVAWIFLWAFLICFAQIYVGVHYPLDILGGTILGFMVGWSFARIFNDYFPLGQRDRIP